MNRPCVFNGIKNIYDKTHPVIFITALQNVLIYGSEEINKPKTLEKAKASVDKRHDEAEKTGKHLFCTRGFEKELLDITAQIASFPVIDLIAFIQIHKPICTK